MEIQILTCSRIIRVFKMNLNVTAHMTDISEEESSTNDYILKDETSSIDMLATS